MYFDDTTAERRIFFHFRHVVQEEKKLAIANSRDHGHQFSAFQIGVKAAVENFFLAAHLLGIGFPALTVRRIGEHKVKLTGSVSVHG